MVTDNSSGFDVPDDWGIHEETEQSKKKKRERRISNNILWLVFILIFVAFASLPFLAKNPGKELQSEFVNSIKVSAETDPLPAVRSLLGAHIDVELLDKSADAHDAVNEIKVVMGKSAGTTYDRYKLLAGITDKTGISVSKGIVRIEGKNRADFWKAVWAFNSILSATEIDSSYDLFEIQKMLKGRKRVYLVEDAERECPAYGTIISAQGDLLSSLGYKQAEYGFEIIQLRKSQGTCKEPANDTAVECPAPSGDDFVITMARGDSNRITVRENEMTYQYADCEVVARVSVIARDLLHPNIVSDLSKVDVPIYDWSRPPEV